MAKESSKKTKKDANAVLKELSTLYPTLTTQLKKAADFVLDHPIEIALLSIRKSAEAAQVTPSTLTRLAETLGFERYNTFRAVFQSAVHHKTPPTFFSQRAKTLQSLASTNPDHNVLAEFSNSTLNNLEHFFQEDTLQNLHAAATMIKNARKVYAMGFRDTFSCAHHFVYMGSIAFPHIKLIRGYQGTLLSELAEIGPEDIVLIIGFEPYAVEAVNALEVVKSLGRKFIAITDSLRSPLAAGAEITFTLKNETPHFFPSLIPAMALIEALLAVCTTLGDEDMVNNINTFENNIRKLGGYYTPE